MGINLIFSFVFALISIISLFIIYKLQKSKRLKFPTLLISSLAIGLIAGGIVIGGAYVLFKMDPGAFFDFDAFLKTLVKESIVTQAVGFISQLFISLMRMLVVPLVLFSILNVVVSQKFKSRSTLFKVLAGLVSVVIIGALLGVIFSWVTNLGHGVDLALSSTDSIDLSKYTNSVKDYTIFGLLASFIPSNIVAAMSSGNVVGVMVFAGLFGMGINRSVKRYPEQANILKSLIEVIFAALTYMTRSILVILPFSVFALIINVMLGKSFTSLVSLGIYLIVIIASMLALFIIQLIVVSLQGLSPRMYLRNVMPALIVAFSTSSSNSTLPVTINSLQNRAGVSEGNATLVPTLATSMGMGACAGIFPAVLAIITLNATGQAIDIAVMASIIFYCVLASFGTQGIPGTATIAATFVLTALGLPLNALVFVLPMDFFVDMFRTMINVNGGMLVALTVDNQEGTLDRNIFNATEEE